MEPEEPPEQNVYSEVTRMGSRGQSRKRQLAQLDRASEKYNSLQEHAPVFYDPHRTVIRRVYGG